MDEPFLNCIDLLQKRALYMYKDTRYYSKLKAKIYEFFLDQMIGYSLINHSLIIILKI